MTEDRLRFSSVARALAVGIRKFTLVPLRTIRLSLVGGRNTFSASLSWTRDIYSIAIFGGETPVSLSPSLDSPDPVMAAEKVTDVRARFVADPFMVKDGAFWYMFFEVWNATKGRGEIGLASSEDTITWRYLQIVLAEPFHLSYPQVFNWQGRYYMLPESSEAHSVRLYEATHFPQQWTHIGDLLNGRFVDASIIRYNNCWWMFASPWLDRKSTLRLYWAKQLEGPWIEHCKSPVILGDKHRARPAGRPLLFNGKVIRFAQDFVDNDQLQVRAFQIETLDQTNYSETEVKANPILQPGNFKWNSRGMHHVDAHMKSENNWIACVDGIQETPSICARLTYILREELYSHLRIWKRTRL